MPYLTGDDLPDSVICRTIRIPNTLWMVAAVNGALYDLAETFNWETFGIVTAQQAADRFWQIWLEYQSSMCVPIGTITAFAGSVAPEHSLICDGASYGTDLYPALFAVIGYTYGGSGANFSVPDLRGRTILGAGMGTGLSNYSLADTGGQESHQLTVAELAAHSHFAEPHAHGYSSAQAIAPVLGPGEVPVAEPFPLITDPAGVTIDNTGGDTAHENRQPYLALNYIIFAE